MKKIIILESQLERIIYETIDVNGAKVAAQKEIINTLNEYFNDIKSAIPKQTNSFISTNEIIDEFKNYMIGRIPFVIQQMETGVGGDKFAYECYQKLLQIIQSKVSNISSVKKFALKAIAPSKQDYLKGIENNKIIIGWYFGKFNELIDFPLMVGWMDYYKNKTDNIFNYSEQAISWIEKNKKGIIGQISNMIVKFIYG
jgi:hypothetical protein